MTVSIETRDATVNIAFSTSGNAALIDRKKLQHTTLSINFYYCTLSDIYTQVFTLFDVLACLSIHRADQIQHGFF